MARFTLDEIAAAVGGRRSPGRGDQVIEQFAIDSRAVAPGGLFFALKGPNHDGHEFLGDAFGRGAAAAVVSRTDATAPESRALIHASETTRALQDLAAALRRRGHLRVVGITGSGGKTTTKEMTTAALSVAGRVHGSRGNLNNAYGLPLALLEMPDDAETAVLEMGMSTPGEIARLVEIADPDIGVILNVTEAHREHFESVEAIAAAKRELFEGMRPDAIAVYNAADPRVAAAGASFPGPKVSFALDAGADLSVFDVRDDMVAGARFAFRHSGASPQTVTLRLYGRHNVANAAAALAVALAAGVDTAAAADAIAGMAPVAGRGVVEHLGDGVVLVDETYNSNPAAVASVLASLSATEWPGRRVVVLGDMLELGEESAARHRETGEAAVAAGTGLLICTGVFADETTAAARGAGLSGARTFEDSDAAARDGIGALRPGDLVVVKGSRGAAMEKFADAVRARFGPETRDADAELISDPD